MKKQLMRCLSLLLCAVLLSVPALAAEPAAEEPARPGVGNGDMAGQRGTAGEKLQ